MVFKLVEKLRASKCTRPVTLASTWAKAEALAPRHKIATATDVALRAENFTCFMFKTPKDGLKADILGSFLVLHVSVP
jgi:hypothetical protein